MMSSEWLIMIVETPQDKIRKKNLPTWAATAPTSSGLNQQSHNQNDLAFFELIQVFKSVQHEIEGKMPQHDSGCVIWPKKIRCGLENRADIFFPFYHMWKYEKSFSKRTKIWIGKRTAVPRKITNTWCRYVTVLQSMSLQSRYHWSHNTHIKSFDQKIRTFQPCRKKLPFLHESHENQREKGKYTHGWPTNARTMLWFWKSVCFFLAVTRNHLMKFVCKIKRSVDHERREICVNLDGTCRLQRVYQLVAIAVKSASRYMQTTTCLPVSSNRKWRNAIRKITDVTWTVRNFVS